MNPERAEDWSPASCLYETARTLTSLKQWDAAIAKHHEAIEALQQDGDRRSLAIGLERLGDTLRQAGRFEEALRVHEQSYDIGMNPERAEDWSPASCLYETARTLTSLKRWDEAVAKHHKAIAAWQQDGDRRKLAIGLELLGDTLQVAGRLEEALKAYQQSYDTGMNPEPASRWYPAVPVSYVASVLGQLGRWDEAIAKHREAIALWQQDGDREDVATALERLGDTLRTAGRHEDAVDAFRKAFDAGTLPEPLDEWDPVGALTTAAEVLIAHGDPHDAVDLLRTAYLRIGATDADGRIDLASDRAIPLSTELARALHASGQTIAALESMHSVRPAAESCCRETAASVELADAAAAWWKLHSELWRALGDDREAVASDRWLQRLNRPRTSQPAAEGD
jgi:tetratricopeptide (TPR) repeat protein